ncbi:MAG: glycosyltransferase family 4 protein [Gaiellales bacterium]
MWWSAPIPSVATKGDTASAADLQGPRVSRYTDGTQAAGASLRHRHRGSSWLRRASATAEALGDIATEAWRIRRERRRSPSPARVLQLIETGGPGGAERMLLDLAGRLGPECHVTVALLRRGWLQSQAAASGLTLAMLDADDDVAVIAELLGIVRGSRIDLIHAHEFYMNAIGAVVSLLTGIPLVATVHGKHYYPDRRRRRVICRMVAAQARSLVTVSHDLRRFLCHTVGIPADRVSVIQNGIDSGRFGDGRRDPALLAASGIPPNAPLIGAVGNLYAVKGHVHLIRALRCVLRSHPAAHLVILGWGEERDTLCAEARALGVDDRVHLLGHRDDVGKWLGAMDVFVSPSLSEGLPLALLEAMAARKPAVVTNVGGMPEAVRDAETGFVVPVADADAMASKIAILLGDPVLAEEMSAAGQARVRELFSVETMVTQYRDVYEKALASPRRGDAGGRINVWHRRHR